MESGRKLVVYIAASVDGYIAGPNDDLSFLSVVESIDEDYGYKEFIKSVDTVIMGRRTYEWVMSNVNEFPHEDKITYIITRKVTTGNGTISFYNGNLKELVLHLKSLKGKNIFCDGGAQTINYLLQHKLIDEFIISYIPVLLGSGISLFQSSFQFKKLTLLSAKSYKSGLLQVHYKL